MPMSKSSLSAPWLGLTQADAFNDLACSGYASKVDKLVPMVGDLEQNVRKVDKRLAFLKLNSTNHHSHVLKKYDVGCGCLTPENLKAVTRRKRAGLRLAAIY